MPDCLNTLIDNDLRDERGMFAIFAKGHMPRVSAPKRRTKDDAARSRTLI